MGKSFELVLRLIPRLIKQPCGALVYLVIPMALGRKRHSSPNQQRLKIIHSSLVYLPARNARYISGEDLAARLKYKSR